ncbi:phage tail protein [Pantoea agglomerans]|jgi:phage-related tail fiber protein|uniref:phage tail protein n=1 Tax=Enterobacter agglomerans TaxID=549 RepID=UPI00104C5816|nr:phage tail protein [Pantoea agglomerans]MDQ0432631.1 phage-related tail fiber protein [Pantoea agglomerans]TCZ23939.1 phage tail protein [Pantoea agglomerans]
MTTKYFALLTNQGAAKLANAAALGTKVNIASMGVGDGGGTLPTPDAAQTKLIGEKRRAQLNSLTVDAANSSQIIAEQIIPESEGGFWIREIGLYDADGVLIAVANCPETYKPQLAEGSGRTQTVRMILIVNSTTAVTLKIDPSVVLATRKYVDDAVIEVKAYADGVMKKHLDADNPHSQYLQIANALSEIKDAGLIADLLKNLGLGEGAPVIGSPFPWPHAKMPNELFPSMAGMVFLKSNGASFSGTLYPKLALAYPGLKLNDLRGEFIRGWDDGRGVDSGRAIGSAQAATGFRTAAVDYPGIDSTSTGATIGTAFNQADTISKLQPADAKTPNNSVMDPVLSDNIIQGTQLNAAQTDGAVWITLRPRNVALNYIVRAA